MLNEAIEIVEDGGDPMNVFRDPATNQRIDMEQEKVYYIPSRNQARNVYYSHQKYDPAIDDIIAMYPQ